MNVNQINAPPFGSPGIQPRSKRVHPAPSKEVEIVTPMEPTAPSKEVVVSAKEKRVWIKGSAIAAQSEQPVSPRRRRRPRNDDGQVEPPVYDADPETAYEWREGWMSEGTDVLSVRLKKPLEGEPSTVTVPKEKLEEDVLMANASSHYPHDLVTLPHFHEPAVVECLHHRYSEGLVYTATGPVLLALNPFKHLPDLYGDDVMQKYWEKSEQSLEEPLPPHVYAIADNSFRSMMRGVQMGIGKKFGSKCDQSILVSGESGAGKTVTTKYLMKYLAALSKRAAHQAGRSSSRLTSSSSAAIIPKSSSIESQVLQSNPILESFGNARTVRNDNSSRFGKFIEMQFTSTGRLLGTKIDTYLLEKVRLVSQNPGERNYHVFYELLSGALPPEDLEELHLSATLKPQDFKILNSGTFDRRDGVSDRDTYKDLRKALNMMGFTDEERQDVFALTAAILHASNLTFVEIENEESALQKDNKHLQPACDLFGLTPEALNDALCYFSITDPRGKSIRRPNVVEKAEKGLDALLKAAYGALFTFLVQKVNEKIAFIDTPGTEARHVASIGVLDIFGFESFTTNSFEQLCINYCNEALQQQFNTFMLKNEQAEYANEGIDWNFIKFPENQDVLDLIDHRTSGIMSILDDMCRAPGATDSAFVSQVYKLCDGKDRFEVSRQNTSSLQFSIHHYAGPVEYTTIGFVEKNRDDLPRETAELLMKSKNPFVHKLAEIIFASGQATPASDTVTTKSRRDTNNNSRPSVGGHFRQQVKDLRAKIDTTAPHYVRCIKPNELLVQNRFDDAMVAQQLRCGGILQAVGVTRDGFTLHYTHSDFINRYGILTGDKSSKKEPSANRFGSNKSAREECKQLVDTMLQKLHKMEVKDEKPVDSKTSAANESTEVEDKLIEFGKSKVLMKHHAFEALERMLGAIENRGATRLNTNFRRFLARTAFLSARESFRKELQVLGQSFDEWFQEHRALYYRSRRKTGKIEIQDIVKHRKQLYKKNTESFSPAPASKKKVSTEKQAWIEINGAWARNPDYKP